MLIPQVCNFSQLIPFHSLTVAFRVTLLLHPLFNITVQFVKVLNIFRGGLGAKYLVFVSSRSVKFRELSFAQFVDCVFIFQYLNDKIHNYVKQNIIVNFIIQKLKNKHTFLKKSSN